MYSEKQANNNFYSEATQTANPPSNYAPSTPGYPTQPNYYQPTNPNPQPYYYNQPAPPNYNNYTMPTPPPKSNKKLIIGIIISMVVVTVVIGLVMWLVVLKPADNKNLTSVANVPAVTTPGATVPGTTTPGAVVSNNSGLNGLVYSGARKVQVPELVQQQLSSQLSTIPNGKLEIYASKDAVAKIKTYYQKDLVKAGWVDMTDEALAAADGNDTVEQVEAIGGFIAVYQKAPRVACILSLPGSLAEGMGIDGIDNSETLIFVISGKSN